jgi:hypothetical protein
MVECFGVVFFLHSGATDDVCSISYAMVEEAIQVLFSIYYNERIKYINNLMNFSCLSSSY